MQKKIYVFLQETYSIVFRSGKKQTVKHLLRQNTKNNTPPDFPPSSSLLPPPPKKKHNKQLSEGFPFDKAEIKSILNF